MGDGSQAEVGRCETLHGTNGERGSEKVQMGRLHSCGIDDLETGHYGMNALEGVSEGNDRVVGDVFDASTIFARWKGRLSL